MLFDALPQYDMLSVCKRALKLCRVGRRYRAVPQQVDRQPQKNALAGRADQQDGGMPSDDLPKGTVQSIARVVT
jgi:hypothetical protein